VWQFCLTRGWALNTVHNSCQPLNCLFALGDRDLLTYLVLLIDGWGIMMDYPCTKFGDFSFSHFRFIMWTDRHTESHTDRHRWSLYSPDSRQYWVMIEWLCASMKLGTLIALLLLIKISYGPKLEIAYDIIYRSYFSKMAAKTTFDQLYLRN